MVKNLHDEGLPTHCAGGAGGGGGSGEADGGGRSGGSDGGDEGGRGQSPVMLYVTDAAPYPSAPELVATTLVL